MTYRTAGVKITVKTSFANNIISSFRCYNQSQFTLLITHCAAVPRRPARGELRERGGDHGLLGEGKPWLMKKMEPCPCECPTLTGISA